MVNKWMVPKGPATHVLMDGGILSVPVEETNEFYERYIEDVKSGEKLYVVEQKTDIFKFFVDLDYKSPEKLSEEDLIQFCSIIHEVVEKGRCCIARARPRPVGQGLIKSGVHIHWPDLNVSRTQALNLRTKIIFQLSEYHSFDWDSIIDASVYGGSGLRMLWSHKKPTGDPYVPWRELGSGREFSKDPNVETLALFAVRTEEEPKTEELLENHTPLETFIRKTIEGQERMRIKRVQRHANNGWFVQTDSKFCSKIRREHKSNHVWFSVRTGRVSQRCFDTDCTEFQGPEHILPPSIVEQLNDVVIVGSPVGNFLNDFFPDGAPSSLQKVRARCPSVLGSGPRELEEIFGKPPFIRKVGFQ